MLLNVPVGSLLMDALLVLLMKAPASAVNAGAAADINVGPDVNARAAGFVNAGADSAVDVGLPVLLMFLENTYRYF